MNYFLSCPPVYTLPGTWIDQDKIARCNDTLIPHGHLGQGAAFAVFLGFLVLFLMIYGIYMTFGKGGKDLRDEIKEHSRLHELGIAHGHEGGGARPNLSKKAMEKDYPQHKHNK
tara:strand:+ start:2036 stop:2377 length:342 start_codon:yes stop_codon:yes gene_type:complete